MFSSLTAFLFTLLVAVTSHVGAAPVKPVQLDVISPAITYPKAGTIWTAGSTQNVTWDASSIPADKANMTGLILYGQKFNNSENLDIQDPIAVNFPLSQGWVEVKVPDINPFHMFQCILVLFGDSGNASPEFTIVDA